MYYLFPPEILLSYEFNERHTLRNNALTQYHGYYMVVSNILNVINHLQICSVNDAILHNFDFRESLSLLRHYFIIIITTVFFIIGLSLSRVCQSRN